MKLAIEVKCRLSNFRYNAPIIIQKHELLNNQLLTVHIYSLGESIGVIDFSALPNFHQYSINEWKYCLEHFFNDLMINLDSIDFKLPFFNMINYQNHFYENIKGEFLFIIESVLLKILEVKKNTILDLIENRTILLNALYSKALSNAEIPNCLKIKIRPTLKSLEESHEAIHSTLSKKPQALLRLDGNQRFEIRDLIEFVKSLEKKLGYKLNNSLEYIEEPLKNFNEHVLFKRISHYPLALDESFMNVDKIHNMDASLKKPQNIILKPSLYGISKCFEILKNAKANNLNIIISSTYESASAMRSLMFLATHNPTTYHGLDTLKFIPDHLSIDCEHFVLHF
jgi:O-succinylbenzoate synthase